MASGSGIIGIRLVLDGAREAVTDVKKIDRALRGLGDDKLFNGIAKGAAGVGAAVGAAALGASVAVGAFVNESLKSLERIQRINSQTESAIAATGGAAKVTAQHIEDMTGALENSTATEAESIQQGANLLLTFTNIQNGVGAGNDIFDQATTAITDMSRAMDTTGDAVIDTTGTAVQLGKALNDPVKGITALSKVGVSFTQDQKDQIKAMVAANDTMGAQKIILNELSKEFGGSGEAFAKTSKGQIELAGHAWGTFGEALSTALLPAIGTVSGSLADLFNYAAENVPNLEGTFSKLADGMVAASNRIVGGVKYVIDNADTMKAKLASAFSDDKGSKAVVTSLSADIGGALGLSPESQSNLTSFMQTFVAGAQGVLAALTPVWQGIQNAPISTLSVLQGVMQWMAEHTTAVQVMASALTTVAVAVTAVRIAIAIWTGVQTALNIVLSANPLGLIIIAIAALVGGLIVAYQKSETFRGIVDALWGALKIAGGWIKDTLWPIIQDVLVGAMESARSKFNSVKDAIGGFVDKLKEAWTWVKKLADQLVDSPIGGALQAVGGKAIDIFGGGRATGGPIQAGKSYLTGEEGPEIISASRSAFVTDAETTARGIAGSLSQFAAPAGGDVVVHQTTNLDGKVLFESWQRHAGAKMARA